jgi:branched-chain amino acid transport system ATP-binding protein
MAVPQRPKSCSSTTSVGLSRGHCHVFNELLRINAGGQTILLVEQNTKKAMEVAHRASSCVSAGSTAGPRISPTTR